MHRQEIAALLVETLEPYYGFAEVDEIKGNADGHVYEGQKVIRRCAACPPEPAPPPF
jgi:hypothetical protein